MTSKDNSKINVSKIIGIQFSILSPDEIRKASVAEITNKETYVNNKPVIGGLFDPRMGVLEPGLVCPTDGLDYINTPGYFGHIELARPVFYIQYLTTILKILRCVCFKCSKLLISKEKYKYLLSYSGEERWTNVFQKINGKIKRCGEECEDGCGCKQPDKVRREGLATIFAEWIGGGDEDEKMSVRLVPETVLKIFKRISNEDVDFMGFNSTFSRPEWMICEVMIVPPPAIRPSIKHDAQQRSEDDITHILVNIIKVNKILQERIEQNSAQNVIDDWTLQLQYFVSSQVDNKIPGISSVAQRSGRPLKSIKERLNGKGGRVRGNLMGKRVDFSARSVITADPNLSIRELGVPKKIAMNITKPVVVNKRNKLALMKLLINGPEKWPGAKILEKKNGESISLRYIDDREKQKLEEGDVVHRHMLDGDAVLFNRQPTLHRMSMMCHIARVMKEGDTFRMNVADTKPYNADFDGDEMNLHMPQDLESESELRNLAAVPYQLVSPSNNKPIVGIFQDSMLGAYQITRETTKFSRREAMNLLMNSTTVDLNIFTNKEVTSFDVLSQILPPITLKYKNKVWSDDEDYNKSNNVLEIYDGNYKRGLLDKGCLGNGTSGIIHRICNDFGNMASSKFIDDFQNIVTDYMKTSSFSVGISDLVSNEETNTKIVEAINKKTNEVKDVIDQIHLGIFENETGKSNSEEFETKVNSILNKATAESGKIGLQNLSKDNRFVTMVKAGSKGSELNISFMISCLGQQNINSKRIPYGFDNRTLPHFSKFDDSPGARGFVEQSYIKGLYPEELFFHAMGGRTGLIDTAVKTSTTGYIQRRLIKGLEDLKVCYDMTVRNNKGKIVQFAYGDDGIDTVFVENQTIPIVNMTNEEIYVHYYISNENSIIFTKEMQRKMKKQKDAYNTTAQKYIDKMIGIREEIVKYVFQNKNNSRVHLPVAFSFIINNIKNQFKLSKNSVVDITPLEAFDLIESKYDELKSIYYSPPTKLFEILYYYYLSPRELLIIKRFNRASLTYLLDYINTIYKRSIVAPGEMVGMIAAQSIGEPTTQMTLNTFHFAGVASKSNVTRGVPRIEEVLSISDNPKNPSVTTYLRDVDKYDRNKAQSIMCMIEHTNLADIVSSVEIRFDPDDLSTLVAQDKEMVEQYYQFEKMISESGAESVSVPREKSKWIFRMELDNEIMFEKNITMDDVHFAIKNIYQDEVSCVYSDYNDNKLIFRIRMNNVLKKEKAKKDIKKSLDQSDEIYLLKSFQDTMLNNVVLKGIKNINKVIIRKILDEVVLNEDKFETKESWVLDTVGSNLIDILSLDYVDVNKTFTNNITEMYHVLGIEAARQTIYNEFIEVIEFDGTYLNSHHLNMLCDRMTYNYKMTSIFRHGINNDDIGALAKASFEETPEMFLKAARHGELDHMRGISANVMCGQEGYFGTSMFQIYLDQDAYNEVDEDDYLISNDDDIIEEAFNSVGVGEDDKCSSSNLKLNNTATNIKTKNIKMDDGYVPDF
jgi:DNA-directed RNA polymerase II subunit RPB1